MCGGTQATLNAARTSQTRRASQLAASADALNSPKRSASVSHASSFNIAKEPARRCRLFPLHKRKTVVQMVSSQGFDIGR